MNVTSQLSASHTLIDLNTVPKFSEKPIRKIPKYVFENCNQVTCNDYSDEQLKKLQNYAKTVKASELRNFYPDPQKRTTKEEEMDWIDGLRDLEENYLSKEEFLQNPSFTSEEIIKINGIFSRFSNTNPGQFREKDIHWPKGELSQEESRTLYFLEGHLFNTEGIKWLVNLSSPDYKPKPYWMKASKLRKDFHYYNNNPHKILMNYNGQEVDQNTLDILAKNQAQTRKPFNVQIVDQWVSKYGDRQKDKIDIAKWFRDHAHFFPEVSSIQPELQKCLDDIKRPDMHPIEKASRIWFEIVKLHISHEANKRSGKAIASAILLAHGYLPPKIGKKDHKEYLEVFKKGLEEPDGLVRFTNFVARKIKETHEEYAASLTQEQTK